MSLEADGPGKGERWEMRQKDWGRYTSGTSGAMMEAAVTGQNKRHGRRGGDWRRAEREKDKEVMVKRE